MHLQHKDQKLIEIVNRPGLSSWICRPHQITLDPKPLNPFADRTRYSETGTSDSVLGFVAAHTIGALIIRIEFWGPMIL